MPTKVPLWLAVDLKQRQRCHIQPPEWLDVGELASPVGRQPLEIDPITLTVETLTERKSAETDSDFFVEMPSPHYIEVATEILNK